MGFVKESLGKLFGANKPEQEKPSQSSKRETLEGGIENPEGSVDNKQENIELSAEELGAQKIEEMIQSVKDSTKMLWNGVNKTFGFINKWTTRAIGGIVKDWRKTDIKRALKTSAAIAASPILVPGILVAGAAIETGKAAGKAGKAAGKELKNAKDASVEWFVEQGNEAKASLESLARKGRDAKRDFDRSVTEAKRGFRDWKDAQLLKMLSNSEVSVAAKQTAEQVGKSIKRQERFLKTRIDLATVLQQQEPIEEPIPTLEWDGDEDLDENDPTDQFVTGEMSMREALDGAVEQSAEPVFEEIDDEDLKSTDEFPVVSSKQAS